MVSKKSAFAMFVLGGVVGFWIGRRYYSEENDTYLDEAVKEEEVQARNKRQVVDYTSYTRELGYSKAPPENVAEKATMPFVIPPDEFGVHEEYEQVSLTYYADSILVGSNDRPLTPDEIANMVGEDAVDHFGEYEDDSVFVQNDEMKCYFEILLDDGDYSDVVADKPYLIQEE